LAVDSGIELYLLNRGKSERGTPRGAKVLHGDIRDRASVESAIADLTFDAVVNWIAFTTDHVQQDIDVFRRRTGQYVFISSASAYQTPPSTLPVTESTILDNPIWEYSRNKIACEEMLVRAYRAEKFPMTIVRPSHTYDRTLLPFDQGWTVVDRMRRGKPVVVHADGASLWVLTHHEDFARAFVPLLGNSRAIGEAYHITSDEWLSWNQIYDIVAAAAGTEARKVYAPAAVIRAHARGWGDSLLADKGNSMVFDNSKIKRLAGGWSANIPFTRGAEQVIAWYSENPARQRVDEAADAVQDAIIAKMEAAATV
jgi:nucleoside-diphosphate-sugar epimerase